MVRSQCRCTFNKEEKVMPYIPLIDRYNARGNPQDEGELAYSLTMLYVDWFRAKAKKRKFKTMASLVGVIVLSLLEFWRRVVVPYEQKKCDEEGDVFD